MNPRYLPLLAFIFTLILAPQVVYAQQEDGASSLLPDIDPQDIEIRGDFDIRFPGLSRQPILGFSPRQPIYRVDPDRMPFIESDDEVVTSIPISQLEPALRPEQYFLSFSDRKNLFARAGFGTYQSPEIKVIAEAPVRENEFLSFDFGHRSSAGERDFSSYGDIDTDLRWVRQDGPSRWGFGVKGTTAFNYSALPGPAESGDDEAGDLPDPGRISHTSFGIDGKWQRLEHAYKGWQSHVKLTHFEGKGSLDNGELSFSETKYDLYLNHFRDGIHQEQVFGFDVNTIGSFYDTIEDNSQYWLTNSAGARYRHQFGYAHQVDAWLQLYQLYDPVNEFDIYLYPDISYRFEGTGRARASIRLRGFIEDPALQKLYSENRFMNQQGSEVQHERGLQIHLNSGLDIFTDTRVFTGLDYRQYYNKGYYQRSIDPANPFYSYQYADEAIHVEWYSGVTHRLPELRTTATLELGFNFTSMDDEIVPSGEIPYVPGVRGSAQILTRPVSWMDASVWLDFSGKRKTAFENEEVDGFVQLGMQSDFRIHGRFGVYFKALNILNQNYEVWHRYQEQPFQFYGGITLHW